MDPVERRNISCSTVPVLENAVSSIFMKTPCAAIPDALMNFRTGIVEFRFGRIEDHLT